MDEKTVIIMVAVIAGGLFVIVMTILVVFIILQRRKKRTSLVSEAGPVIKTSNVYSELNTACLRGGSGKEDHRNCVTANVSDQCWNHLQQTSTEPVYAKVNKKSRSSSEKIKPKPPPKPSFRGKENNGFVSDDSGYTTLDTTVRSVDVIQDPSVRSSYAVQKRIHVVDSPGIGPYAVIDIVNLRKKSASDLDPNMSTFKRFDSNIDTDLSELKAPSVKENFYFELEKEESVSSSDSNALGRNSSVINSNELLETFV